MQKLQGNPDKEVSVSVPKPGKDGLPTKETNTVKTTAGAVARALINRVMVAKPNEPGAASTQGVTTTVREAGLSGATDLVSIRNASPELVRSVIFVHEGMHGFGAAVDRVMSGGNVEVYNKVHQDPYNQASYDLLYR